MLFSFPDIDPVAFQVGPLAIRWYALSYLIGILLGWRCMVSYAQRLSHTRPNKNDIENFINWAVMGIILGGRLGYVLFYNFDYYSQNLLDVFQIWNGGMSFHGGMLGVFLAVILFCKKHEINLFVMGDVVALSAPIGLLFGRLANFINGELYGRVTSVSWGMVFPNGGPLPRHPSQLYEALLEGLILFVILYTVSRTSFAQQRAGLLSGLFFSLYAIFRSLVELVREPDLHIGVLDIGLTMGQVLSIPMLLAGCLFIVRAVTSNGKRV